MKNPIRSTVLGLTVATLAAAPVALEAQETSASMMDDTREPPVLDLQVEAGTALPTQEFADYVGVGIHAGVGAAWWLSDHVAVRADGAVDAMPGDDQGRDAFTGLPDTRLFYLSGGLQFDVGGRSSDSPWSIQATAGAGSAMLDTEVFIPTPNNRGEDITQTYPQVNAGVEVGYDITENVQAQLTSGANVTFVDDTELNPIWERNAQAEPTETIWTMPITAALSIDLPH